MRPDLLSVLTERVLVADGAMGTMLQAANLGLDDFQGFEGCNEILNVSRPDVVRSAHDAYLSVGCDAIETNTFGANLSNLGEYDIPHGSVGWRWPERGWPARSPTTTPPRTDPGM